MVINFLTYSTMSKFADWPWEDVCVHLAPNERCMATIL